MMKKRQYDAIDLAKYISALLVVCIHTYPLFEISETVNLYWMATVCRLAVPFFFVTSSFFFFSKWKEKDAKECIRTTVIRLGKLYLVWTLLYLPLTIRDFIVSGHSLSFWVLYVRNFFLTGSYYHLWFLPSLIVALILVSFLYQKKGMIPTLKIAAILYGIGWIINVFGPLWQDLPLIQIIYGFYIRIFDTARNGFFFGPIFVALGLLLANTRRLPEKVSWIGFGISFVLLCLEVFVIDRFGLLQELTSMFLCLVPAVYFLVNALLRLKVPKSSIYPILRMDSTLIYTSHIYFSTLWFSFFPEAHIVVYFLTLASAQAFSTAYQRAMKKFPILKHGV